jgi:hypothetical protein
MIIIQDKYKTVIAYSKTLTKAMKVLNIPLKKYEYLRHKISKNEITVKYDDYYFTKLK